MSIVKQEVYQAIENNNMDKVLFADPFTDVTRKAKRNLLAAGFVCLLISILNLEITGFLGLKASNINLGNEIAQGLGFIITIYFLITFLFYAYIDYSAWNFRREKQQTLPYFDLIHLIENHIGATSEQLKNAIGHIDNLSDEDSMQAQLETKKSLETNKQKLTAINTSMSTLIEEITPLLSSWRLTISKMNKLSFRLKLRFISLWGLDIIFPISISIFALFKSYSGIPSLVTKIMS